MTDMSPARTGITPSGGHLVRETLKASVPAKAKKGSRHVATRRSTDHYTLAESMPRPVPQPLQ